jgi:hypothetical protein
MSTGLTFRKGAMARVENALMASTLALLLAMGAGAVETFAGTHPAPAPAYAGPTPGAAPISSS